MKRKSLTVVFMFAVTMALAQNGYRVEIKQVFPQNSSVYSNVFDYKREMDKAIETQCAKIQETNCNYQVFITTPSSNETRNIQNIVWVESINGKRTYHKKKTAPAKHYMSPTVWEGYSCNIDGSRKGKVNKKEFIYRVTKTDSSNDYETAFVCKDDALAEANRIFEESFVKDRPLELLVYQFGKDTVQVYRKANDIESQPLVKQADESHNNDRIVDSILQQQTKGFVADMRFIHEHRDSLQLEGVHNCRQALEKASLIPDSLFVSQRFDTLYRSVLANDVLSYLNSKKTRNKIEKEVNYIMDEELASNLKDSREFLLRYTKIIETTLFPQNKEIKK